MTAVVRQVFEEYGFTWESDGYCRDLYEFEDHYLGPDAGFWVAEVDGAVVGGGGFVRYDPNPMSPEALVMGDEGLWVVPGADCEVCRLYLLPSARGRGLGRELLDVIVEAARSKGCRLMEIWSDKSLVDAHRLYERAGAVLAGERIDASPDRAEEWGYRLDL